MILPAETVPAWYRFLMPAVPGGQLVEGISTVGRMIMGLLSAYSSDVLAALAIPAARYDTRNAELLPNVTPKWYVIEVYPNAERRVAEELMARRFGIFIPESDETVVYRGRKVERVALMFPGYIFVFVWDVFKHLSRIETISGVMRVLMTVDCTPLVLTDQQIDEIRTVENGERPIRHVTSKVKRRRRKNRASPYDVIATRAWSPFQDGLLSLDSQQRNQTLQIALGLCS